MACGGTHVWTFCALVGAFLDLTIALLLLCCATITYLVSIFLSLFDLALPCPCNSGLFGAVGEGTCHLVQGPVKRIGWVQRSVRSRAPFDSMFIPKLDDWDGQGSRGSSFRSCTLGSSASRGMGSDFVGGTPPSGGRASWAVARSGGGTWVEEDEVVRALEIALEEERRARSALYVELDKERSAAGSAAEEAMAMIERLQKEKATVKMNARHYQRMAEEKSAYEQREMEVLKEIILRREKELYVLGKEVEVYRKGSVSAAARRSSFQSDDDNTSAMLRQIRNSILNKKKKKEKVISDDGNGNPDLLGAGDARRRDRPVIGDRDFHEKGIVTMEGTSHKPEKSRRQTADKAMVGFPCGDARSESWNRNHSRGSQPEPATFDVHAIGDEVASPTASCQSCGLPSELAGIGSAQSSSGHSTTNQTSGKSDCRRVCLNNTRMKSADGFPLLANGSLDSSIARAVVNSFRFSLNSSQD